MKGEHTVMHGALLCGFRIEDLIPTDHLLRAIDRFVDLGEFREHIRPYPRAGADDHDASRAPR